MVGGGDRGAELRSYASFDAEIPEGVSDTDWMEAMAKGLADALRARGHRVGAVRRCPFAGLEFTVRKAGSRALCILEWTSRWLLVCEPRRSLLQRLTGREGGPIEGILGDLVAVLASDPRVQDVEWTTREEYERAAAAVEDSAPPEDAPDELDLPEAPPGAEELIAEGVELSRPCLELYAVPGDLPPVGVWKADRTLPGEHGRTLRHVISVDCRWLHAQGFDVSGTLTVFGDDGGDQARVVEEESLPVAEILAKHGGTPLRGRPWRSFPPSEALFHFGRKLAATASPDALARYDEVFQERGLFRSPGPTAVLGGWHVSWPDSDEYDEPGRLVLFTLRDAEPWYEVWTSEDGFLTAASWST